MSAIPPDRDLIQRAMANGDEGILLVDAEGMIAWANPAATTALGHTEDELRGRPAAVFCSAPDTESPFVMRWHEALAGTDWRGTLLVHRQDGGCSVVRGGLAPVKDDRGAVEHVLLTLGDDAPPPRSA